MTRILAAKSAAQGRFIAWFQVAGSVGRAENPNARLGAGRDIMERTIGPRDADRAGDCHVDERIGGNRIGKLRRDGLAACRASSHAGRPDGR